MDRSKNEALGAPRYWKIAPGEDAWNWEACRKGNFIAVGWDDLGDVSKLSRSEFNSRWDEVAKDRPGWTKGGRDQVWVFTHEVKKGDRVVANKGTTEVLAIGTVTGQYKFSPGVRHGHRLSVDWDDLTRRRVDRPGWRRTIVSLTREEFDAISAAPPIDGPVTAPVPGPENQHRPFTAQTFELFSQLHNQPTRQFYLDHKDQFKHHVEGPIQKLLSEVRSLLPRTMTDVLETEKGLFGRILKNDFGAGRAWDFYWGAFYPKGGSRIKDAQLFVWMNHEGLEYGFSIGDYGSDASSRFIRNFRQYQDTIVRSLSGYLSDQPLLCGERHEQVEGRTRSKPPSQLLSLQDWLKDPAASGTDAAVVMPRAEVLGRSAADLSQDIAAVFQRLFPLVLMSMHDNPSQAIGDYIGEGDGEDGGDEELNAEYSLAQCADETGFDQAMLEQWVRAIERKGQAIIYGPPGTGKTFLAERLARHLIGGNDGFVETVQFHAAYAYEDFIQGLRPVNRVDGSLEYQLVPGRFLDFSRKARARKGRCVLIVDEINRANLARVFGELMYLLEYRDREVPLAGGGVLSIPSNIRILGTMNTADRSIALVDHALRRRFAFLALHPDYAILSKYHEKNGFTPGGLIAVLRRLNDEIGDAHYEIGISFFLRKQIEQHIEDVWRMEIEPYLEEYFFDQPQKISDFRWEKVGPQILQ